MLLQPPPPASPPGSENERIKVKMMEKRCIEFVVENYSSIKTIGVGNSIRSSEFVGGHLFTLEFYPDGCDSYSYDAAEVSLLIKNENEIRLDVVFDLLILNQSDSEYHLGYSCFHDRTFYKNVTSVEAGERFGYVDFWPKWYIQSPGCFLKDDSIIIRATIGVLIDAKVGLPLERCILFKVRNRRYYVEESVVTTRCPALLSQSHSHSQSDHILISDVDNYVFEAMLWFINNQLINKEDSKAIVSPHTHRSRRPHSFALEILAAADRFHLKDLRTQCQSLVSYGSVAKIYYDVEADFKKLRTYGCRLWGKVKEAISQKIKES